MMIYFQDLIIFPDDIEFKHVKACTTGRVFVLKFKSSTRKFFFWMQVSQYFRDTDIFLPGASGAPETAQN